MRIWKCDIRKFFDSVDQEILLKILSLRIKDNITFELLKEVVYSYSTIPERKIGMPIGNLTSQIFANIYLNEFDRFVNHKLKPRAYLRYGDDFVLIESEFKKLEFLRIQAIEFLKNELKLEINPKNDKIIKPKHGVKYLGVKLWPFGRTLTRRNLSRAKNRLSLNNISSYSGLTKQHRNYKQVKRFNWQVYEKLFAE